MGQFAVAREQAAAVGPHSAGADRHPGALPHQAELHGKPEESGQSLHVAGEDPDPLRLVLDLPGPFGGPLGKLAELHQRLSEGPVGMHRNVAGDVVEDVRFGEIVERGPVPDGDGGGELALLQAVEEQIGRHVAADRFGFEAGARLQKPVDIGAARHLVGIEVKRLDAFEEAGVGIALPAGPHPLEQPGPGAMVFLAVEVVRLVDVQLTILLGELDKGRLGGGQAGRDPRGDIVRLHRCAHKYSSNSDPRLPAQPTSPLAHPIN